MRYIFVILLFIPFLSFSQYKIKDIPAPQLPLLDSKNIVLLKNHVYTLKENKPKLTQNTDLLVMFNEDNKISVEGNYAIDSNLSIQNVSYKNRDGGMFYNWNQNLKVILKPDANALFSKTDILGDFTIDFWINPFLVKDGEKIFSYFDIFKMDDTIFQSFEIIFFEKKIVWNFSNIIAEPNISKDNKLTYKFLDNIKIESLKEIIPHRWSHHMLRYSFKENKLEYLVDGVVETIIPLVYKDTNRIFLMGRSQNGISIANQYNGLINDFRISKEYISDVDLNKYKNEESYALFGPIDLEDKNEVVRIIPKISTPGKSKVELRYIISNDKYKTKFKNEDWFKIDDFSKKIENNLTTRVGQYLYILVNYLNSDYENSPVLDNISVYYYENLLPPPPEGVMIEEMDGGLKLKWRKVPLNDIKGYMIYISEIPGNYTNGYFIDAGLSTDWIFRNLENGKTYYFMLTSYNNMNSPQNFTSSKHIFSKEYSGTPSRFGRIILDY